jgi:hypothetical protein
MRRRAVAAALAGGVGFVLAVAALVIWSHFDRDIERARARVANGSVLVGTPCGPIEYCSGLRFTWGATR